MRDDSALLRAAKARWLLVPAIAETDDQDTSRGVDEAAAANHDGERHERAYLRIALPDTAIHIDDDVLVGSDSACKVLIKSSWVSLHTEALHPPSGSVTWKDESNVKNFQDGYMHWADGCL